jgi:hypothetical protein
MSAEQERKRIDNMSGGRELGGTHFGQVPGDADTKDEKGESGSRKPGSPSEQSGSPLSDTGPAQPNDVDQPDNARGAERKSN